MGHKPVRRIHVRRGTQQPSTINVKTTANDDTLKDLNAYYDALERHDWHYMMSDDYGVYLSGNKAYGVLTAASEISPEHKALFDGFEAYHFSGAAYGTPQAPRPVRPTKAQP